MSSNNKKKTSIILCFIIISAYLVLGNCLTFNLGNRIPIKVSEIIAIIFSIVLLIINGISIIKPSKNNLKLFFWFILASIPIIFFKYTMFQRFYGLMYSARIIFTVYITIIISNVFMKFDIKKDIVLNYILINYLIVVALGVIQLLFWPNALDFYNLFYKIGVYFPNPDPHIGRLLSTYFDPNFLACCLIIPYLISVDYFCKTRKIKYCISIIIFTTAIILTVSRSGTVGIALVLIAYFLFSIKFKRGENKGNLKLKWSFIVGFITLIVFIFLTFFSDVRVFKRLISSSSDASTYARVEDWKRGIETTDSKDEKIEKIDNKKSDLTDNDNRIIGVGYNMIGFNKQNQDKTGSSKFGNDSSLLLIYISSGIIGLVYFIVVVLQFVIRKYKMRKMEDFSTNEIIILITSLVLCNFNNLLFYPLWIISFFLLTNYFDRRKEENL